MRRIQIWLTLTLLLVVLTTGVVVAGTFRSPSKDTTCQVTTGGLCEDETGILAQASQNPGDPLLCTPVSAVGFIGWDLSMITEQIGSAELVLTTYRVTGAPTTTPVTFELFEPSTHDWSEDGAVSPGSSGNTIATTSVLLANVTGTPQTVVFGGSDAVALGAYFNNLRSPGPATVGIRISGGCTASTLVYFNDKENTGNLPGGAPATEPDLLLFSPTAVSVAAIGASSQSHSGALVALLIAAVLVLGAGTAVYYRRQEKELPQDS